MRKVIEIALDVLLGEKPDSDRTWDEMGIWE